MKLPSPKAEGTDPRGASQKAEGTDPRGVERGKRRGQTLAVPLMATDSVGDPTKPLADNRKIHPVISENDLVILKSDRVVLKVTG